MVELDTTNLLSRGIAAAKAGNRADARRLLLAVTETDPSNEVGWLWLASVAESPQESIEHFNQVLTLNPKNSSAQKGILTARLQQGISEARAGNPTAAREELRAVVVGDRRNEAAWHWLASVAASPQEARDCLRKAVELNPRNEHAQRGLRQVEAELAEVARVCPLCSTKAAKPPVRCAKCGAMLSLADPRGFLEHSGANTNQMKAAVTHYEKVLATSPDFPAQLALGLALLNLKSWKPALAAIREAVALQPHNEALRSQFQALFAHKAAFEEQARQQEQAARRTVMVIDDSPTVRKLVALTLEKEGFQVVAAADGYEAAERLRSIKPDLILLDIMMPGIDGYQVCKLIKGQPECRSIPVVMLSGKDGFFDKIRGRMAGCTDYLTKPFDPAHLLEVVKTCCKAKA